MTLTRRWNNTWGAWEYCLEDGKVQWSGDYIWAVNTAHHYNLDLPKD